ncbi:MAG: phosphoheptose isomerase [Bacteroidetes bacterium]|nr:phosphoheptose isomerase [Bacteroidota bacterium]MBX7044497.1 phosphoheptose isomerase [Ignavibacteria bacterium]
MLTKEQIAAEVAQSLEGKGLTIVDKDFERPWGGFYRIADSDLSKFLDIYYQGVELPEYARTMNASPKILVVAPEKRLSWQVHERRSEVWRVVKGPVAVYKSPTDEQPDTPGIYNENDVITLPQGTRHRLVGENDWGVIAEIWVHIDPAHPTDENDIRRIQDDFGR